MSSTVLFHCTLFITLCGQWACTGLKQPHVAGASGTRSLNPKAYKDWFFAHGNQLWIEQDTLGVHYAVQYRPPEINLLLSREGNDEGASLAQPEEEMHARYFVFWLRVSPPASVSAQERREKTKRPNSMALQRSFQLVVDKDTLPCAFLLPIEETLKVSGQLIYQVGFLRTDNSHQVYGATLVYRDLAYGTGPLKFVCQDEIFTHLPSLKY